MPAISSQPQIVYDRRGMTSPSRSAGLLESQKGHGGGFTFARDLSEIRFADVLEAVDYEIEPSSCVFGWGECSLANPCPLHPFWSELKDDFAAWANAHTLAEAKARSVNS